METLRKIERIEMEIWNWKWFQSIVVNPRIIHPLCGPNKPNSAHIHITICIYKFDAIYILRYPPVREEARGLLYTPLLIEWKHKLTAGQKTAAWQTHCEWVEHIVMEARNQTYSAAVRIACNSHRYPKYIHKQTHELNTHTTHIVPNDSWALRSREL